MLTPDQLKEHSFTLMENGCYSAEEVNRYFGEVIASYNQMYRENGELIRKISILANKVQDYRRDEDNIRNALLNAQRSSERILADAKKQADEIIAGANRQMRDIVDGREGIVTHAKEEAERLLSEARVSAENIVSEAMQQSEEIQFTAKAAAGESQTNAQNAAEKILADANQEAMEILTYTKQDAQSILTQAQQQAQQIIDEARKNAQMELDAAKKEAAKLVEMHKAAAEQAAAVKTDIQQEIADALPTTEPADNEAIQDIPAADEEDLSAESTEVPENFSDEEAATIESVRTDDAVIPPVPDAASDVDSAAALVDEEDFDSFDDFAVVSDTDDEAAEQPPELVEPESEPMDAAPVDDSDDLDASVSDFVVHVNTDDFGEYDENDNFDDFGDSVYPEEEQDAFPPISEKNENEDVSHPDAFPDTFSDVLSEQPADSDDGFTIDFSLFEDDSEPRHTPVSEEPIEEEAPVEFGNKKKSRRHRKKK